MNKTIAPKTKNMSYTLIYNIIKTIILLIVFFACGSCSGQTKKDQNNKNYKKPSTEINDNLITQDNFNLNKYKNDEKHGLWREYYKNGQLKSEANYVEGEKEGMYREWLENGTKSVEGIYENGKANGLMIWYHEGGNVAGMGNMIGDIRVGKWKICDIEENGFCIEAYFKIGKRHGIWKINYVDVDKLWKEQTFKEDQLISERCFDKKGKEIECN